MLDNLVIITGHEVMPNIHITSTGSEVHIADHVADHIHTHNVTDGGHHNVYNEGSSNTGSSNTGSSGTFHDNRNLHCMSFFGGHANVCVGLNW